MNESLAGTAWEFDCRETDGSWMVDADVEVGRYVPSGTAGLVQIAVP